MRKIIECVIWVLALGFALDAFTSKENSPFSLYRRPDFEFEVKNEQASIVDLDKYVKAPSNSSEVERNKYSVVIFPACSSCSTVTQAIETFLNQDKSPSCLVFTENETAFRSKFPKVAKETQIYNLDDSINSQRLRSTGPGVYDYDVNEHTLIARKNK